MDTGMTPTGRMSIMRPRLQNIRLSTPESRALLAVIRRAHQGEVVLHANFAAIELRLMEYLGKEDPYGQRQSPSAHGAQSAEAEEDA